MKFTKKRKQRVKRVAVAAAIFLAAFHGGIAVHKFFFTTKAEPLSCKILRVTGDSNSDMFRDPHDPSAVFMTNPTQIQCINSEKDLQAIMPTNEDSKSPRL